MNIDEIIQQPGMKERMLKQDIMKSIHVAIPGEIEAYYPETQTAIIQPVIRDWNCTENPPLLLDVPVFMWGGYTITPQKGDGCLVICADSCIDSWFQSGGVSTPVVARTHSLSDGFAFVGFRVTGGKSISDLLSVVTKEHDGLCPKLPDETGTTKFLRQDGTWSDPSASTGSVTAVEMNGTVHEPVDGTVDLGTVVTDVSGKKDVQTAKSDPTASGTAVSFIDTLSQNAQGVISATKKTVRTFTKSGSSAASGLVPAPSTTAGTTKFLREDATWQVALTEHQDISGKKNVQTAVSDPTASGTDVSFIATLSQNAQGVITATKKTVRTFTKSGSSAASGMVPAPSTTAGTTKFLREDATWQVALTQHQDISGKKNVQTAVSDPSANGVSTSFIATLTQNAQGVVTATKKKVTESFSIPASGSKTFNIGNNYRGVFFIIGGTAAAQDVITVYSTSAGSVAYKKMGSSANLTVTLGTGTIKIANSNTYAQSCYVMTFSGSVS